MEDSLNMYPKLYINRCRKLEQLEKFFHLNVIIIVKHLAQACMSQMEFIMADFIQLDSLPVTNHHLFPSMLICPLNWICFHGRLEMNDTTCMTVVLIYDYRKMSIQGDTNAHKFLLRYMNTHNHSYIYNGLLSASTNHIHSQDSGLKYKNFA